MSNLKAEVKSLINNWNKSNDAAVYRNQLRKMANGQDLADYIFAVADGTAEQVHPLEKSTQEETNSNTPLRDYAKHILRLGYNAEHMTDKENAMRWIKSMAAGYQDEHDLNEEGLRFWKAVKSKVGLWMIDRGMEVDQ